ncbi:hypothetical protein NEOLEDRAFT_1184532 [Neolentinus lepideus HHB14362 ss-1]|uniref:Uncharacterized protein n=1 Tax=Neolentinus lepideus HHB14362 ss-1 TaxID=1314782 RepID=A0A165MBY3_9AGAM|nr:hypothetical protein NEOLEDRAFT_1184532 [Neolentinus lepideus HHB14362 ss-1]
MLWGRQFMIIAVPVICLVTATALVFESKQLVLAIHTPSIVTNPTPEYLRLGRRQKAPIIAQYMFSCITNVLMSGMIAFRIWKMTQDIGKPRSKYLRVAWLILETGVLYAICLVLSAILYGLQSDVTSSGPTILTYEIVGSILQQLVGIFPAVIILLVALGKTSDRTIDDGRRSSQVSTMQFASPPPLRAQTTSGTGTETIELQPVCVTFKSESESEGGEP